MLLHCFTCAEAVKNGAELTFPCRAVREGTKKGMKIVPLRRKYHKTESDAIINVIVLSIKNLNFSPRKREGKTLVKSNLAMLNFIPLR